MPFLAADRIWRLHAWRLALLWALLLAAYSNSFQAGLFFDNAVVILQDPRIQTVTPGNIWRIVTEGYWHINANSGLYRPLTTLSYLLNYALFGNGAQPTGYHWVNFAIHGINVTLVYGVGMLVFRERQLALSLAAIWGLHPLLTDSVTNVIGRADLLAAFGVLAGLICYARSSSATGRRRLLWRAGLVLAQAIGLFSKENAAVLPAIMLLYDVTWAGRAPWRERVWSYTVLALPFTFFFIARSGIHTHMLIEFSENPLVRADVWTARLTAIKVVGKYVWLFFWPARLSPDYSYNAVPLFGWRLRNWEDSKALITLAIGLTAVPFAFYWRRSHKRLFFFAVFFFVALSPTSNLFILIGSIMAERFVYLPSVGLAGCFVAGIYALGQRLSLKRPLGPQAAWITISVVCVGYAARTYARNFDWQDERTLWTRTVSVCPEGARPHVSLGRVLSHIPNRLPDAIAEYQTALRIQPDSAQAHYNLGIALEQVPGRLPNAIAEYQAALRLQPESADAHNNLGVALSRTPGRQADAMAQWQAALRIQPDHAGAHYNLGNTLSGMPGRLMDAVAEWQAALRSQPDLAEVHYNLGNVYSQLPDRLPDAIAEYQAAVRIQPDFAQAHNNLGNAFARIPGRSLDAINEWQAALRNQPDLAEAHYNLGNALAQMPGRRRDAIAEFEAGLRIKPDPAMRQILDQLRAGQR